MNPEMSSAVLTIFNHASEIKDSSLKSSQDKNPNLMMTREEQQAQLEKQEKYMEIRRKDKGYYIPLGGEQVSFERN